MEVENDRAGNRGWDYWLSRLGLLLAAVTGLIVVLYFLFRLILAHFHTSVLGTSGLDACMTSSGGPPGQPSHPPFQGPVGGWGGVVLFCCFLAFVVGSWWGVLRLEHQQRRRGIDNPSPGAGPADAKGLDSIRPGLQVLLVGLLSFVAIALFFEAFAAINDNHTLPAISLKAAMQAPAEHKNKYGQDYDPETLKTDY